MHKMDDNQQHYAPDNFLDRKKIIFFCYFIGILLLLWTNTGLAGDNTQSVWMMRHALAPGFGDPPNMVLANAKRSAR
jgi:hypothetical protein